MGYAFYYIICFPCSADAGYDPGFHVLLMLTMLVPFQSPFLPQLKHQC